jgi:MoaA/NifB/PqqE/SkfB family radical SAM enzyme
MKDSKNKYSIFKLVWHREKMEALSEGRVVPPLYVRVKPTNRCIHSCPWCVYHQGEEYKGIMHEETDFRDQIPDDRLINLMDELADVGVKCITFSGGGEPLLHPAIEQACLRGLDRGLDLSLLTNGQLLKGRIAEIFLESKWVRVSIDYWNATSFGNSRRIDSKFFHVINENMKQFARKKKHDLTVNFIVTKENHEHIFEVASWLGDIGVDNVRFSPVWVDDFIEYHGKIKNVVLEQLEKSKGLQGPGFTISSSYDVDNIVDVRPYSKCYFQQVVPVIGADQFVYSCHNQAYSSRGKIGSIEDQSFGRLWSSRETKKWFDEFDARTMCSGIQCAADRKNLVYGEMLDARGDSFV